MIRIQTTKTNRWPCTQYPGGVCPDRVPGCQSKCIKMLVAQLERDAERREIQKRKASEREGDAARIVLASKRNRKKPRER